jgi:pimeloyl-ACP methyl ester carboxylesterase
MNARTHKAGTFAACLALCALACGADAGEQAVRHSSTTVDGIRVFYREAGPRDAPVLLLLHGFPSSSHMFRHLIPALSDRYRVIAPDYPGFGQSAFPPSSEFEYTFARYASLLRQFTRQLGLTRYALYIQDYGAPIGLRLALHAPENVTALIVQNGNAYESGLSPAWDPLKAYWRDPSSANREVLRGWLVESGVREQYTAGLPPELLPRLSPDTWTLDWALLARPGNIDVQLGLFADYATNVQLYPRFQQYLREYQPPTLITWGRHDPFFTTAGAAAYQRDLPNAELHLLDAGHFALETHGDEIAALIRDFLDRLQRVEQGA